MKTILALLLLMTVGMAQQPTIIYEGSGLSEEAFTTWVSSPLFTVNSTVITVAALLVAFALTMAYLFNGKKQPAITAILILFATYMFAVHGSLIL